LDELGGAELGPESESIGPELEPIDAKVELEPIDAELELDPERIVTSRWSGCSGGQLDELGDADWTSLEAQS
jgi:hypothetical protein